MPVGEANICGGRERMDDLRGPAGRLRVRLAVVSLAGATATAAWLCRRIVELPCPSLSPPHPLAIPRAISEAASDWARLVFMMARGIPDAEGAAPPPAIAAALLAMDLRRSGDCEAGRPDIALSLER